MNNVITKTAKEIVGRQEHNKHKIKSNPKGSSWKNFKKATVADSIQVLIK